MNCFSIRSTRKSARAALFAVFLTAATFGAIAQEPKPATPPAPAAKDKDKDPAVDKEAPLPAPAHVAQSIQLEGKTLAYTAAVGTMPVYDKDGKKSGEVVCTSYTMEGNRPPRDLRPQWRTRRVVGLSEFRRHRTRSASSSATRAIARPTPRRCTTIPAPGSTSPTSSSSIPSAPASAGRWSRPTSPRSSSTAPTPTSNTSRASSTTGW